MCLADDVLLTAESEPHARVGVTFRGDSARKSTLRPWLPSGRRGDFPQSSRNIPQGAASPLSRA